MTDWRFDIVELNGAWGITDSHGPLRVFTTLSAALDEAKAAARTKVASDARVEIYTWSNGRAHKVFDSLPVRLSGPVHPLPSTWPRSTTSD